MHRARLSHCLVALTLLLTLFLAATAPATAQNWPTRPVKFILTLGPGSGADISARLLADRLAEKWGQPIVIENKPGGDGIVAINAFVSAQDDHVLLYGPSSSFIGHPYQHDTMPYNPADLAPIARVSNTVVGISVPASLPAKSLKEVVEAARAKPGQMNWAGLTGALDIMFESWLKSIGVDVKKVPYRNPVEAANDLAAGRVQIYEFGLCHRPAAGRSRQDSGSRGDQHHPRGNDPRHSDRRRGRLSGFDHRRAGRTVRPARHADGAA